MPSLLEVVQDFESQERPVGIVLESSILLAQMVAATSFCVGYGHLESFYDNTGLLITPYPTITANTDITYSEYAIIKPLFMLYVERETALYNEASRGMGIDPFGRLVAEVAADITMMEQEMPHKMALHEVVTV